MMSVEYTSEARQVPERGINDVNHRSKLAFNNMSLLYKILPALASPFWILFTGVFSRSKQANQIFSASFSL